MMTRAVSLSWPGARGSQLLSFSCALWELTVTSERGPACVLLRRQSRDRPRSRSSQSPPSVRWTLRHHTHITLVTIVTLRDQVPGAGEHYVTMGRDIITICTGNINEESPGKLRRELDIRREFPEKGSAT